MCEEGKMTGWEDMRGEDGRMGRRDDGRMELDEGGCENGMMGGWDWRRVEDMGLRGWQDGKM